MDIIDNNGEDCIAEKMLEIENFACAFIGNTRYGWINEGQTDGPSLHLHREFLNAIYADQITSLGAAHLLSRLKSAAFISLPNEWEPGALRWCFYDCNVLGDAAMNLWSTKIEQFQKINYSSELTPDYAIYTGVPGARVTLSLNGEFLATTLSDNDGLAVLTFDSTFAVAPYKLIITAANYKPYVIDLASQPFPSAVVQKKDQQLTFSLKSIYPNPFNPIATIEFSVCQSGPVMLTVFNTLGQQIKLICNEQLEAGNYKKIWDGKNDFGDGVASGLYFLRLKSAEGIDTNSCLFLR